MQKETGSRIQEKNIWFGLARIRRKKGQKAELKFAWGKIGMLGLCLGLIAWIGLSALAFIHFRYRRDYREAAFVDTLLLPFRYESFQRKRGEYYIDTAFQAVETGDFKTALHQLRNGLLRVPDDWKARKTLAEIYEVLLDRPGLALDLLIKGIPFFNQQTDSDRRQAIEHLFRVASRNQLDQSIIDISDRLLGEPGYPLSENQITLIQYQRATAYRNLGFAEVAEKLIDEANLTRFAEGLILEAQLLWDQGSARQAIELLEQGLDHYRNNAGIYDKLIQFLEEEHQIDRARQYRRLYTLDHTDDPRPHLSLLTHYYEHEANGAGAIDQLIEEYLGTFAGQPSALRPLLILCSQYGDTDKVRRIANDLVSSSAGVFSHFTNFVIAESEIRAGRFEEASHILAGIEPGSNASGDRALSLDSLSILHSLRAAVLIGEGQLKAAGDEVTELLSLPLIKADRYLAIARLFLDAGSPDLAHRIIHHCMENRTYEPNVAILEIEILLEKRDIAELVEALPQAMKRRRLPNPLLHRVYHTLCSDRYLHLEGRTWILNRIQDYFRGDFLFTPLQRPASRV